MYNKKTQFLGSICKRAGHKYEGSGKGLRWKKGGHCVECQRESNRNYYRRNVEEAKKYARKHYKENIEKLGDYHRKYWEKITIETFNYYPTNGKIECEVCGKSNINVLLLDHIEGAGGRETRKEIGSGTSFYVRLKKHNYPKTHPKYFPKGLRLLCQTCNLKDMINRIPPPETKRQQYDRKRYLKLKKERIDGYSGGSNKCFFCGEDDFDVLCINHIDSAGGAITHKELVGGKFHYFLRKEGYPETHPIYFPKGLNVLCPDHNHLEKKRVEEENLNNKKEETNENLELRA